MYRNGNDCRSNRPIGYCPVYVLEKEKQKSLSSKEMILIVTNGLMEICGRAFIPIKPQKRVRELIVSLHQNSESVIYYSAIIIT